MWQVTAAVVETVMFPILQVLLQLLLMLLSGRTCKFLIFSKANTRSQDQCSAHRAYSPPISISVIHGTHPNHGCTWYPHNNAVHVCIQIVIMQQCLDHSSYHYWYKKERCWLNAIGTNLAWRKQYMRWLLGWARTWLNQLVEPSLQGGKRHYIILT